MPAPTSASLDRLGVRLDDTVENAGQRGGTRVGAGVVADVLSGQTPRGGLGPGSAQALAVPQELLDCVPAGVHAGGVVRPDAARDGLPEGHAVVQAVPEGGDAFVPPAFTGGGIVEGGGGRLVDQFCQDDGGLRIEARLPVEQRDGSPVVVAHDVLQRLLECLVDRGLLVAQGVPEGPVELVVLVVDPTAGVAGDAGVHVLVANGDDRLIEPHRYGRGVACHDSSSEIGRGLNGECIEPESNVLLRS